MEKKIDSGDAPPIRFLDPIPIKMPNGTWMLQGTTLKNNVHFALGIDPGVNFGMTIINMNYVQVFWGRLPSDKRAGWRGIHAYNYLMRNPVWAPLDVRFRAVVEGASYHSRFGQVGLEEVRFGFFLALHHLKFDVSILAPASVRLMAFGSGRQQAGDLWPTMNQNAADSIGCALAALSLYDKNE